MESKLLEYRARKRKEALIQVAKDKINKLVTFNATPKMNTVDMLDDSTPVSISTKIFLIYVFYLHSNVIVLLFNI